MRNGSGPARRILLGGLVAALLVMGSARGGAQTMELLPDLATLPPIDLALEEAPEGRLLRFTARIANVGAGPIRIQGLSLEDGRDLAVQEILGADGAVVRSEVVSEIIFHPHHKHWHTADIAAYELRRGGPEGPVVARNGKVSFCLVDDEPLPGYAGDRPGFPQFLNCETHSMGLSQGWVDVYHSDLPDQWVEIAGIPDGVYYLTITADPADMYIESDDGVAGNNRQWVKLQLSGNGTQVRVMPEQEILVQVDFAAVSLPAPAANLEGSGLFVPVDLARSVGIAVAWEGTTAVLTAGDTRVSVTPGAPGLAYKEQDTLMLPLSVLTEGFGVRSRFDPLSQTLHLFTRRAGCMAIAPCLFGSVR